MGLISENMAPGAAPGVQPTQEPSQPPPRGPSTTSPQPEEEEVGDPSKEYVDAVNEARRVLYKEKGADHVVTALKKAHNLVEAIANLAYDIAMLADQAVGGVPDEDVALLGVTILEEITDIAEAGGMEISGEDAAQALKLMVVRFVEENGQDPSALREAMDKVDSKVFNEVQ